MGLGYYIRKIGSWFQFGGSDSQKLEKNIDTSLDSVNIGGDSMSSTTKKNQDNLGGFPTNTAIDLVGTAYGIGSDLYDKYQTQKWREWQKDFSQKQYDESVRQYGLDFAEAQRQYEKNYGFQLSEQARQQENFDSEVLRNQQNFESEVARDQYNLEHQYQTAVADASKAGINPLALSGFASSAFGSPSSISGGSVSAPGSTASTSSGVSGSNSITGSNRGINPFSFDLTRLALGQRFEASENAKDRQTSKEIAELQEKTKQDEIMYNFLASSNSDATERLKIYKQEQLESERISLQRELGYLQNDIALRNFSLSQYNSVVNLVQGNERIRQDWIKIQNQMQQFETEQNMRKKELMWKNINSELDRFAGHIDTSLKCGTDIIKSALTVFGLKGVSIGR